MIPASGSQRKAARHYLGHRGMKLAAVPAEPRIVCCSRLASLGEQSSVSQGVKHEVLPGWDEE